jgi:hypothetical protein
MLALCCYEQALGLTKPLIKYEALLGRGELSAGQEASQSARVPQCPAVGATGFGTGAPSTCSLINNNAACQHLGVPRSLCS